MGRCRRWIIAELAGLLKLDFPYTNYNHCSASSLTSNLEISFIVSTSGRLPVKKDFCANNDIYNPTNSGDLTTFSERFIRLSLNLVAAVLNN